MMKGIFLISVFLFFFCFLIDAQEKNQAVYIAPHSASEKAILLGNPDTSKPLKVNMTVIRSTDNVSKTASSDSASSYTIIVPNVPANTSTSDNSSKSAPISVPKLSSGVEEEKPKSSPK